MEESETSNVSKEADTVSPRITLKNVDVSLSGARIFGSEKVLKDISLELKSGDRLCIIGRNGAGKSTLLKLLAGILQPDRGTMEVVGESSALFNLSIGVNRAATGRRNMYVRNLIAGRSRKEILEHMPAMIEFADIGEYIDRPLGIYSQGMAMRTVFSAATEFRPPILLMDEWLGVGDEAFRRKSRERMREMVDASGIIVLATHHHKLAREVCNLGLYLDKGKVKFLGDIDEAWQQYKNDLNAEQPVKPKRKRKKPQPQPQTQSQTEPE